LIVRSKVALFFPDTDLFHAFFFYPRRSLFYKAPRVKIMHSRGVYTIFYTILIKKKPKVIELFLTVKL
jgi:hypothetical protein